MNQLQKKEFELLQLLIDICEQLGLTYYLVCGSALGAVKYKGFIPWDDDIDIALPRKHYNILLQKANTVLPENVFLQNHYTDPNCPFFFSKLRDSNTTFIEKSVKNIKMNHGVYIDVFPIDGYPYGILSAKVLEIRKAILTWKINSVFDIKKDQKFITKMILMLEKLCGCDRRTVKYTSKLDNLLSKYDIKTSKLMCNYGNWQGKLEYAPREQYGKGIQAEFEELKVIIPEKYDDYLTQKYGDWRSDIPDEEKHGHHYCEVCDLSRSYLFYCDPLIKSKEKTDSNSTGN